MQRPQASASERSGWFTRTLCSLRRVRLGEERSTRASCWILPHYGRGPKGEKWQFEESFAPLLEVVEELLDERAFLVLSTYAIGYSPLAFHNLLSEFRGGQVEAGELALREAQGERLLPCGFCARWWRDA